MLLKTRLSKDNKKKIDQLKAEGADNNTIESESEKLKELRSLSSSELLQQNLHTEVHWMGIFEAAEAGMPCIIDEVNIIRPEVFMALNDLLQKRPGDNIKTPNGLDNINVKDGFCIILTGNDPDQSTDSEKYKKGRYSFDEATYNRLRVYAKNYLNQAEETHKENRFDNNQKKLHLI